MHQRVMRMSPQAFWTTERWTVRGIVTAALVLLVVYSLLLPFALLDLWVTTYQAVAFRLLGMRRIERRHYFAVDRHRLSYLNPLEKANCLYCGYVNGVIALTREIAARTEQFWCPIQHRRRPRGLHARHRQFAPYGDEKSYERLQPRLRRALFVQSSSSPDRQSTAASARPMADVRSA
jgi:hypothetical protein